MSKIAVFIIIASAGVAFLKSSVVTGLTKICYYDYLGSQYAITIKATEICPLTIRVYE